MIDTHSHLFVEEFFDDLPQVVARAKEVGVKRIFMPNIDDTTVAEMLKVCGQYPDYCFPMIGFHPTSVDGASLEKLKVVGEYLKEGHPFVAIGEVGMDLYWDKTYLLEQQRILDIQINWALEWDLPIVLHCRDAFPELFQVLKHYKETPLSGIFHSFTGTEDDAAEIMSYSRFMIGVNGVVTFKKSTLPEVLKKIVPMERLVTETDSPYLAPTPFRGKRNESSYLKKVTEKLSEVYDLSIGEVEHITASNALKVFKISEEVFKVY